MRVRCNTSYRTVHEHNKALTHPHKCMSLDTCLIVFDFVGAKFEAKIVYACITTIAITRGILAGPIVCMFWQVQWIKTSIYSCVVNGGFGAWGDQGVNSTFACKTQVEKTLKQGYIDTLHASLHQSVAHAEQWKTQTILHERRSVSEQQSCIQWYWNSSWYKRVPPHKLIQVFQLSSHV